MIRAGNVDKCARQLDAPDAPRRLERLTTSSSNKAEADLGPFDESQQGYLALGGSSSGSLSAAFCALGLEMLCPCR